MEHDTFSLLITSLRVVGNQVAFWGQKEPHSASIIERELPRHIRQSPSSVPNASSALRRGDKCFVCLSDGMCYRVQVIAAFPNRVQVLAIDYGFELYVDHSSLRIPSSNDPFITLPGEAEQFYLYEAQTSHALSKPEVDMLDKSFQGLTLTVKVVVFLDNNVKFAIFYEGTNNVRDKMLQTGLIMKIPFNAQKVMLSNFAKFGVDMHVNYKAHSFPDTSVPPPITAKLRARAEDDFLDNPSLISALAEKIKGQIGLAAPPNDLPIYPPPKILTPGTTYSVLVTDCADGPWSFSVQLASDAPLLEKVTEEMQKTDKVFLRPPIFPGKPCLGFYSAKNLYARGVVVKVSAQGISVTFVDYGGTEDLNMRSVFEMPSHGFHVKTLSQQYCLAQLPQLKGSNDDIADVKHCFAEIVNNKMLLLKVTLTEDNCLQNCELYDPATNVNVKKGMNQKIRLMKKTYVAASLPTPGASFSAFITHVESLDNFYVQNRERETEILQLLDELQTVAVEAVSVAEEDVQVGLSCLSQFDGLWYRARVLSSSGGTAVVFFVDYGNTDSVQVKSLKDIPRKYVTKYKTFALHCCLENAETLNQSICVKLEELINDEGVSVNVVNTNSSQLTVRILKDGRNFKDPPPSPVKQVNEVNVGYVFGSPEPALHSARESPPSESNGRSNWRESDRTENRSRQRSENDSRGFNNEDGGGFKKRFDRDDGGGGFKKRFDKEDGGGFWKSFDNEDGGAFKKRFDNEDGGGFRKHFDSGDGGGFKKRFDNDDGGGFKKRFDNEDGGGFKKRFDNEDGGGFKKRFDNEDGGGFKKRFDSDDGGGFKKRADAGNDSNRPFRVPIRNEDRASSDSTFEVQSISAETAKEVSVTYFVSPLDFYVQSYTDQPAFTQMMERIQTEYVNKFCIRQGTPLQEGDIVVAKFSDDRVLYRAEIISPDPISVRFVDYGNVQDIRDNRDIYPVLKDLVNLPRQSVKCSLHGVKPVGDSWADSVASYFEKSEMTCTFWSENDGVYSVSITSEDGDVAAALIAAGLAVADDDAAQESGVSPVASPDAAGPNQPIGIDPFDAALLPGQVLLVEIPYINGVDQFSCHFSPSAVKIMTAMISDHFKDPEIKETLDAAEILPGKLCMSVVSDVLYRAKIIEKSDDGVFVKFIDYGDANEVTETDLFRIPDHIEGFPPLSFECYLVGDTSQASDELQDRFKDEYESKPAIISVHSKDDESVAVTVYNLDGTKSNVQEGINDSPATITIPDLPLVATELNVNVLKLSSDLTALISLPESLLPDLASHSFTDETSEVVTEGSPCVVKCPDDIWRRAVRKGESEAYLVDVGDTVKVTDFRPLPADLFAIPAFVRHVRLSWPVFGANRVKVNKLDNVYQIDPVEKIVYICHVESANEFYVKSCSIDDQQNEIQELLSQTVPCDLPSAPIISARFPDDGLWYRAKLVTEEPLCVHFIDFGNKSEVSEVGELPPTINDIPPLSMKINLKDAFPDFAKEVLENESLSECPLTLVEENGEVVDLLLDGSSVVAKMHGRLPLKAGDTVHISFVVNPAQFYVQRATDSSVLESLSEKLAGAESFPEIGNDCTKIIAAKYVDDDAWYRAKIENEQVFFIDHGNYAEMLEIRELPEDLEAIPPLAQQAILVHPTITEWPDSATEALMELLDGRPLLVEEAIPYGRSYKLVLTDEGLDVATILETNLGAHTEDSKIDPATQSETHYSETEFTDQPTDDHKTVALTDDQRAERNETDEQKRGKMEGPRSDDEKGEPSTSGIINMPDSELELEVVTSVVEDIIDNSMQRDQEDEGSETDVVGIDSDLIEINEANEDNSQGSQQIVHEDQVESNSVVHTEELDESNALQSEVIGENDDVINNEESPFCSPQPNFEINTTCDVSCSDDDSGLSSHPLLDTSNSPEVGDVAFEDAISSPGSADTVPVAEEDQGNVEFLSDEVTTPIPNSNGVESVPDVTPVSGSSDSHVQKSKLKSDGSLQGSTKIALSDKIVPGSINRGIDLTNDFSSDK